MPVTSAVHKFLFEAHVPYAVVPHDPAFTAQEGAAALHVPGRDWAKVVTCVVDGVPIEAVVPATMVINMARLLDLTGGSEIRLAQEDELRQFYPDCESGAMPPFGSIFGQAVFVDITLAAGSEVVFHAGNHEEAIAMRWRDFAKAVRPVVGAFAEPLVDRVGDFRLSFRE